MSQAPKYIVKVVYGGVDISQDISRHLISCKYVDQVHGKSDEIEISLEDSNALWRNEWYPKKGDLFQNTIGPDELSAFDCGEFWIDELEASGPPDVIIIRGLATGGKGILRTKNSSAHEGKSLKSIAQTIADNNGLKIDDGGWIKTTLTNYDLKDEAKKMQQVSKVLSGLTLELNDFVLQGLSRLQQELSDVYNSVIKKQALKYAGQVKFIMGELVNLFAAVQMLDSELHGQRNIALNVQATNAANVSTTFFGISGVNNETSSKSGAFDGIVIDRCTQNHETDLGFLKRLCDEYGIVFSIRSGTIFFMVATKLEGLPSVSTIDRQMVKTYSFKDKIEKVYKSAKVKYHNPVDKEVVEGEFENPDQTNADGENYKQDTSDDTLIIHSKAENKQQAAIKAQAALHKYNSNAKDGEITLPGNPLTVLILAGNNIDITGFGVLSGKYHVLSSAHEITKGGAYEITASLKFVGTVEKSKNKSATIPKTRSAKIQNSNTGFADGIGIGQTGNNF